MSQTLYVVVSMLILITKIILEQGVELSMIKEVIILGLGVISIIGLATNYIVGRKNRKIKSKLTTVEQEQDLYNKMVEECIKVQKFSKFLKNSMTKENLANYKHNTVLENIRVYALACGYTWYHEDNWSDKINEYIKNSKEIQN